VRFSFLPLHAIRQRLCAPKKRGLPRFRLAHGLRPHSMTARLDVLCRLGAAIIGGSPVRTQSCLGRIVFGCDGLNDRAPNTSFRAPIASFTSPWKVDF
jgi:hypothetical protein